MATATNIDESNSIVGLYLLWARLLNEELSPELRDILLQPEVTAFLSKVDPDVDRYLSHTDFDYEKAAVEFCDTFILPQRSIQPRAAAWLGEGDSISPDGIHAVVDAFLINQNISLPPEYAKLPYDHASVLFYVAAVLREKGSEQAAEFEAATLQSWIGHFARSLSKKAASPLYRSLGEVLLAA